MRNIGIYKLTNGNYTISRYDNNYNIHNIHQDIIKCKDEAEMKLKLRVIAQNDPEERFTLYCNRIDKHTQGELEKIIRCSQHFGGKKDGR